MRKKILKLAKEFIEKQREMGDNSKEYSIIEGTDEKIDLEVIIRDKPLNYKFKKK